MSKFNEGDYPLERAIDGDDAPRKPPAAASAAPDVNMDVRTPPRAKGRLAAMANAARQRPDARASNHQLTTNQPSADARPATLPDTTNPVTNILDGTPVSSSVSSNVSNDRWA